MMFDLQGMPKVLQLYLELSQYPVLSKLIRQRMREEIFRRGIVSPQLFEQEIHTKAIESQLREGITDPLTQETLDMWQERTNHIRDNLTDFYFAYNLPHDLFKDIVQEVIAQRAPEQEIILSFNPELAPWDLLFAQGEAYESYPVGKRVHVQHHLREIKAVLIKAMISDQLAFVRVAREELSIANLKAIRAHRTGRGKIGGKAAGMYLAYKILERKLLEKGLNPSEVITMPESFFIGADVFYEYQSNNDLFRFMNQKYKEPEQMIADYPQTYEAYMQGQLPDYVKDALAGILDKVGESPLIVRSSSLLEDSFERSFAGKYDSFFLPNQGTPEENLTALMEAINKVYASVSRPSVLIYRQKMELTDYDERMAIMIQRVEGQHYGRYFFPALAGVAFSHNPYRWNERIRAEEGLVRLVTGLGTRAVNRVGSDYPRMIALSHPTLRPEHGAKMLRHYSQHRIDVLDLEDNEFKSLDISDILDMDYPSLGAIMSLEQDGFVRPMISRPLSLDPQQMIVTFDQLVERSDFVSIMHDVLTILEEAYGHAVDVEFTGEMVSMYPKPQVRLALLQCRPLSHTGNGRPGKIPSNVPAEDILFTASQQVPNGVVEDIEYIVYVDPHAYASIPDPEKRIEVGRVIGRLNQVLAKECFILIGPGRWGTSNIQLGVKVTYADIYNTRVLIEVAYADGGITPEVSYGTHFFQDLVEANIYPLPLYPDDPESVYQESFFSNTQNSLQELLPEDADFAPYVKVLDILSSCEGRKLKVVMNSNEEKAIGYLVYHQ
ncbi:MAG: phosphoenolpyruvate synthase [Anaerolineae bacterium]|nr:phosphoenolpyruvate synthase [Anaerolineae bacterium]